MFRRGATDDTIVMILGGGQGERLYPLTRDRAKPAVPFGGTYRIIDFSLSNCLNSGLRRVYVLTQYKSISLERHLRLAWSCFNEELGEFVIPVPPQQRTGAGWYQGTADAIYQNIYTLERERPKRVLVLAGDHVYKMDYLRLIEFHQEKGAEVTVPCAEIPLAEAHRFGIVSVDLESRIVRFDEKPAVAQPTPGKPDRCLASMGIYLFNTPALVQHVIQDSKRDSSHDFGRDLFPRLIRSGGVFAYPFGSQGPKRFSYWRDIGTLDAYWQANMDLLQPSTPLELHDREWPIRTYQPQRPPARILRSRDGQGGQVLDAIVSQGCVVIGRVERSVLSPGVRVEEGAEATESVLMDDVVVGRGSSVRRAVVDKEVTIPPGVRIGWELDKDRRRFTVTDSGIVIIPKEVPPTEDFWRA